MTTEQVPEVTTPEDPGPPPRTNPPGHDPETEPQGEPVPPGARAPAPAPEDDDGEAG
jgi:hypothetical protein